MVSNNEFLIEKEEMWAKMLVQVLEERGIPCTARPVLGVGFAIRTGLLQDRFRIYVPATRIEEAREIVDELFSENA